MGKSVAEERRMASGSLPEAASFLAALPDEERDKLSRYAGLELPEDEEHLAAVLRVYNEETPETTPSGLLAVTGAQAGFARDLDLARRTGEAALELADTEEERQLAHVCLAQTHFQNRRDPEELARFEEHCRAAVELGHSGSFCYERLATLYEYRGELGEAAWICRRAVQALEAAGDDRSAEKFHNRLGRLSEKE